MTNTESRLRAALKAELDAIEPSAVSWEVIRHGQVARPQFHRNRRRPLALALGTAAAVAAVVVALVTTTAPETGRVTDLAPADPEPQPGLIVDEIGDARPAHLDLTHVGVGVAGDRLQITWTLAGPVPDVSSPVDYRVAFTDRVDGGDPMAVVVRLDGDTRAVGVGRCRPDPGQAADCADSSLRVVSAQPRVDGDTVSVSIPVASVEIPIERLSWTADVRELR